LHFLRSKSKWSFDGLRQDQQSYGGQAQLAKAIFGLQSWYCGILYLYNNPNLRFDFLALHGGVRLIQTVLLHEY